MLDVEKLIANIQEYVERAVVPLKQRIAELEARQPEKGEKGDPGPQGAPGADAEPVPVADIVSELVKSELLNPVLDLFATDAVAKHFEANPVQHGKDGERGPQGEKGEPGAAGSDGADGIGLAGALIDRDGALVVTLTNGMQKSLGPVVGKDGINGRDGLSMTDVSRSYDSETHEVVERWTVAGEQKELRYPAGGIRPGGFWREGMKCFALQAISHNGSLWIAKRDTAAKPCLENDDDWQLAARQGRDGRDGKDGKPPPGPISLKDDGNA